MKPFILICTFWCIASLSSLLYGQQISYDSIGRKQFLIEPNGTHIQYTYDLGGNIRSVTVTNAPPICSMSISMASTMPKCPGGASGRIEPLMSNGTAPYSFVWSNGDTNQTADSLVAGVYSVTVTDAVGCTASAIDTLIDPLPFFTTISGATTVCPNASTSLLASGGNSYTWSNGSTGGTLNNAVAGIYGVTASDAIGCTASTSVQVMEHPVGVVNLSPTHPCPNMTNGSVTASIGNGAIYTYNWSTKTTGPSIYNLSAGVYQLTATSPQGCTTTGSITLQGQSPTVNIMGHTAFCVGSSSLLTASGAISYVWSNRSTLPQFLATTDGTYSVIGTDANGCTGISSVTVTTSEPSINRSYQIPTTCGLPNGTLSVDCTGGKGTAPFQYLWSNGNTGTVVTGLLAGSYIVTITDALGCTLVQNTQLSGLSNATSVAIQATPSVYLCNSNGVQLMAQGSGTFLWSNGQTTQSILANTAGVFQTTMTDAFGCTATGSVTVISPASTLTISGASSVCPGMTTVLSASGGNYNTYRWSNGSTDQSITVGAGSYSLTVSDEHGCTFTTTSIVNEYVVNPVSISGNPIICANSIATLTAIGSNSYIWSNGVTSSIMSTGTEGNYSVTGTNSFGCTASSSISLTNSQASLEITSSCISNQLVLTASQNASYLWSTGHTTQQIYIAIAGTYCVTATNNDGCSVTACDSNSFPLITSSGPTNICSGGSVTLTATNGASYLWSNGSTTQSILVSSPTGITATQNYNWAVTVTQSNGCVFQLSQSISVNPVPSLSITSATNTRCNDSSPVLLSSVSNMPVTYSWSNGATSQDLAVSSTGYYTLTVTNTNGCTAVKTKMIVYSNSNTENIIYVRQDATGSNDGSSWANGYTDIQFAIAALVCNNADIYVSEGVYLPTPNKDSISTSFVFTSRAFIYGGFPSSGNPTFSARNPNQYLTVLSGDIDNNDVNTDGNRIAEHYYNIVGQNSLQILRFDNPFSLAIIDGFTFTAPELGFIGDNVGRNKSHTISNCKFMGLKGQNSTGTAIGISGDPLFPSFCNINNCYFLGNNGDIIETRHADLNIDKCEFRGNNSNVVIYCTNHTKGSYTKRINVNQSLISGNGGNGIFLFTGHSTTYNPFSGNLVECKVTNSTIAYTGFCGLRNYGQNLLEVNNSIIWGNDYSSIGGTTYNNSHVERINQDAPEFIDTISIASRYHRSTLGDFRLKNCSPAINTGNNSFNNASTDLNGQPRVHGNLIDKGAYEFQGNTFSFSVSINIVRRPCQGENQGTLSAVVNNPNSSYSYLWCNGMTSSTITGLTSGSYAVTVTSNVGCTRYSSTYLHYHFPFVNITGNSTICQGSSTTLSALGAITYTWSTGATTSQIAASSGGTYTVIGTNADGCTSTASTTVTAIQNSTTITGSTILCPNSSVVLTASLGARYIWSNGATTQSITANSIGNYCVTTTDSYGCSSTTCKNLQYSGTRIYVNINATGMNNGSSWEHAYTNLSNALVLGNSCQITEVWVAKGTYYPTNVNSRFATFNVPSGVQVYGGFQGTETSLSSRNLQANPTILSGDLGQANNLSDNAYHVVTMTNPSSLTTVDGFIIEKGNANGSTPHNSSGGIYITSSNSNQVVAPNVKNCIIRSNSAYMEPGGIGLFATNNSTLSGVYENLEVINNSSSLGYAGGLISQINSVTQTVFNNCKFNANQGGGLRLATGGATGYETSVFTNCEFNSNSTRTGFYLSSGIGHNITSRFIGCKFNSNTATGFEFNGYSNAAILIESCEFRSNNTGMKFIQSGSVSNDIRLTNCQFVQNGIGYSSTLYSTGSSHSQFNYCNVYGNTSYGLICSSQAATGYKNNSISNSLVFGNGNEGIYLSSNNTNSIISLLLQNCTVSKHSKGISMANTNTNLRIDNSIIWGNSTSIYNPSIAPTSITYSDIQGGYSGIANVNLNPMFVNFGTFTPGISTSLGNFRLSSCSPLINLGLNSAVNGNFDLDGNPRINGIVDMGAYELQSSQMLSVRIDTSSNFCNSSTSVLTAVTTAQGYIWNTGATTNSIPVTAHGVYSVTVTDQNGCSASNSINTAQICPSLNLVTNNPQVQLHSYMGSNELIKENTPTFIVQPNPTSDLIIILISEHSVGTLEVFNLLGHRLFSQPVNGLHATFDMTNQPNGIYFVKLHTPYGETTEKVIKVD